MGNDPFNRLRVAHVFKYFTASRTGDTPGDTRLRLLNVTPVRKDG